MTARIQPVSTPSPEAQKMLDGVQGKFGRVPNIFATLGNSSSALESYLNFNAAMAKSKLPAALREQVALTVAGANGCDYCASAHTALGKMQKVEDAELARNLSGQSGNEKTQAALAFVRKIVDARGHVTSGDISAVRGAGYNDEEVVELVALTALNIFTNYFNHIAETEVDFPLVSTETVSKAA